jgi:hypothetical protein
MSKVAIAGLDASGQQALLGIVTDGRGNRHQAAKHGIAGLDHRGKIAACGVAGVNTAPILDATHHASFGVAGVKDASTLRGAQHGIAGNLSSTVRPHLPAMLQPPTYTKRNRLGDQAAQIGWQHGVYFADFSYVVCTDDRGKGKILRWRKGRDQVFSRDARRLPLFLDSTAYRRWTGTCPRWVSFDVYLQAINLIDPDGFAAYDVIGDQAQSVKYFDTMVAMGYGPGRGCFPIYHVRPAWRDDATVTGLPWRNIPAAARCAVANARIAARDPVMKYYARKSRLIGLGGMVRGPIPRDFRHYYIAELCRLLPDHQWWGLGQANFKVVNGLGAMGLLNRVWTDGTWWILDAACERFAVIMDGQIKMHSLEGVARSFFTITECMAANLRSLLSAYAGLWEWPPPDPLPLDQHDEAESQELFSRFHQAKLELFGEDVKLCGNVPVKILEDIK